MDEVVSLYAVLHELQALLATGTVTSTVTGTVCGQRIDTRSQAPT
jgi:hypothetical protein